MRKIKLNIGAKLMGSFMIVIALLIGVFAFGMTGMNSINQNANNIANLSQENYLWQQWEITLNNENINVQSYCNTIDVKYLTAARTNIQGSKIVQQLLSEIIPAERKPDFDDVSAKALLFTAAVNKMVSALDEGPEALYATVGEQRQTTSDFSAAINNAIDKSRYSMDEAIAKANNTKAQMTLFMIILCVVAVLLATGVALILSRSISNGINKVKKALQKMATGDLSETVNIKSSDEVGAMASAYNDTQKYLHDLITQLKQSAVQLTTASDQLALAAKQSSDATQQVASSSGQMARGAQEQSNNAQETTKSVNQLTDVINQLAKGAEEQSAGVQQAVSSISEVSKTMAEVANNANQASKGAKIAAEAAITGAEKSRLTLTGMDKIKESATQTAKKIEELGARSTEIGKIVAVIDDIAAQTNLLALNAAIEAARAGEQGRGFAVVSDEVRKLAERSATATKEIADLISNIQKGIKEANQVMNGGVSAASEGYNLALQAGQALDQILKASSEVSTQVEQISTRSQQVNEATGALVKVIDSVGRITDSNTVATVQMTTNAVQVSRAVETVAGIAEENSAATEQVSASAEEMSAQVEEIVASAQTMKEMAISLEQSVAMFKLDDANKVKTEDLKITSRKQKYSKN